jgi:hypothetical protein
MNPISNPSSIHVRPTHLDDRRKRRRKPLAGQVVITCTDGPLMGQEFEAALRDFAGEQTSFLLKTELRVGWRVELDILRNGQETMLLAEVIRSRLLSNGRWEIAIELRKQAEAPKMSESQRRHLKRREKLARAGQLPQQ